MNNILKYIAIGTSLLFNDLPTNFILQNDGSYNVLEYITDKPEDLADIFSELNNGYTYLFHLDYENSDYQLFMDFEFDFYNVNEIIYGYGSTYDFDYDSLRDGLLKTRLKKNTNSMNINFILQNGDGQLFNDEIQLMDMNISFVFTKTNKDKIIMHHGVYEESDYYTVLPIEYNRVKQNVKIDDLLINGYANQQQIDEITRGALLMGEERGKNLVTSSPNAYNLYTKAQYDAASTEGLKNYTTVFSAIFDNFNDVMNIGIFPGITLGLIIGFPILCALLLFILKLVRG